MDTLKQDFSMKKTLLLSIILTGFLSLFTQTASAQNKCDLDRPIVFAGFSWDSVAFHNQVARYILEKGYQCKTDEIPGSTIPLFNGMLRGNIDIAMEIWTQSVDKMWDEGIKKGKFKEVGTNLLDAVQGFYVPKYLIEGKNAPAPDLKKVVDLKKYALLFKDPEDPTKGRFYNCTLGWSCAKINSKKLQAYGLKERFIDFAPGASNAVTSAVESALRRKKPVVFYYWTPSWLIGKYQDQLVMLKEPAFNEAIFDKMQRDKNPTQATAYAPTILKIGVRAPFVKEAPTINTFLGKYRTSSALVSSMLSYMQEKDKNAEETAIYFLKNKPEIWQKWVPQDVAKRVAQSLK